MAVGWKRWKSWKTWKRWKRWKITSCARRELRKTSWHLGGRVVRCAVRKGLLVRLRKWKVEGGKLQVLGQRDL